MWRLALEARRSGVTPAGLRTLPAACSPGGLLFPGSTAPRPHLPAPPWSLGWRRKPRPAHGGGDPASSLPPVCLTSSSRGVPRMFPLEYGPCARSPPRPGTTALSRRTWGACVRPLPSHPRPCELCPWSTVSPTPPRAGPFHSGPLKSEAPSRTSGECH